MPCSTLPLCASSSRWETVCVVHTAPVGTAVDDHTHLVCCLVHARPALLTVRTARGGWRKARPKNVSTCLLFPQDAVRPTRDINGSADMTDSAMFQ